MFLLWLIFWACIVLYVILNVYIYLERRKYRHFKTIPVPISPIWFLGALPEVVRLSKGDTLLTTQFYLKYGWNNFAIPVFDKHLIYCTDLNIISKVQNDRIVFPKSDRQHKIFGWVAGVRILGPYGMTNDPGSEVWAAKRRIMDPAFQKAFLRSIMVDVNALVDRFVDKMHGRNGQAFDVTRDFCRVVFEAISICGFNWEHEQLEIYKDHIIDTTAYISDILTIYFKEFTTFNLPWSRREEKNVVRKEVPPMREYVMAHLQDRKKNGNSGKDDILSYILRSNLCSDQLTDDNLVDDYFAILAAGMETTAITMGIVMFYLSIHPDVLQKVQQEVDEVFGDKQKLEFEDLNQLVYLEMVIKECLRIKAPIPMVIKKCAKDNVVINGCSIPNGAVIFIPIQHLQNDPRYWDKPTEFIPERFGPVAKRSIKNYTFMPFSLGQRRCIGRNFAMLEIKTVVSRMVKEFNIVNPNPLKRDLKTSEAVTQKPIEEIRVRFVARN